MQLQILGSWNKFKYTEIQNTKKQPTSNKWMKSLQSCNMYQTLIKGHVTGIDSCSREQYKKTQKKSVKSRKEEENWSFLNVVVNYNESTRNVF
jgi:hypothetical protein